VILANSTYIGNADAGIGLMDAGRHAGVRTSEAVYSVNLPGNSPATGVPQTSRGAILGCDLAAFLIATLPGGSIAIYDSAGRSGRLAWRWGQMGAVGIAPVSVWSLFYRVRRRAAFSEIAWRHTGRDYRFTASARRTDPVLPCDLQDVTIDGLNFGTIRLSHGPAGITRSQDNFGLVRITALSQNGTPSPEV
jgi:hypothetical protein